MNLETGVWRGCYEALLPWTRTSRDALNRRTRAAVERSLRVLWLTYDETKAPTDSDAFAVNAAAYAYHDGWFDAVLGGLSHDDEWPPSLRPWANGVDQGRGRAFRPTIGSLVEFMARFRFTHTLDLVAAATRATTSASGAVRVEDAVVAALTTAWSEVDRGAWDDADWFDYLDVEERVGWVVAACDSPVIDPASAAHLARRVAETGGWDGRDGWSPWSGDPLPAAFLDAVATQVTQGGQSTTAIPHRGTGTTTRRED